MKNEIITVVLILIGIVTTFIPNIKIGYEMELRLILGTTSISEIKIERTLDKYGYIDNEANRLMIYREMAPCYDIINHYSKDSMPNKFYGRAAYDRAIAKKKRLENLILSIILKI